MALGTRRCGVGRFVLKRTIPSTVALIGLGGSLDSLYIDCLGALR